MTAVDLVSLAARGEMKVVLARGVVSQAGSGTDYTGWSGVSSVFVEAKVEVREQSRGAATLTLTLEGSSNGSDWSTLETFTFGHGGSQSATVSSPPDHLRVSWAVGGHSEWQIIEVTAAPSVIDFTGGGGGDSQPILLTSVALSSAQVLAAGTDPQEIIPAPGGRKYIWVFSAIAHYRAGTTPYDSDKVWYLGFGSFNDIGGSPASFSQSTGLNQATDQYSLAIPQNTQLAASAYENLALSFTLGSPVADGDGTLTVRVTYAVIDGAPA